MSAFPFSQVLPSIFKAYFHNFWHFISLSILATLLGYGFYQIILSAAPNNSTLASFALMISDQARNLLLDSLVFLSLSRLFLGEKISGRLGHLVLGFATHNLGKLLLIFMPFLVLDTLSYQYGLPLLDLIAFFFLFAPFYNLLKSAPNPLESLLKSSRFVFANLFVILLFQGILLLLFLPTFSLFLFALMSYGPTAAFLNFPLDGELNLTTMSALISKPFFVGVYSAFHGLIDPLRSIGLSLIFFHFTQQPTGKKN